MPCQQRDARGAARAPGVALHAHHARRCTRTWRCKLTWCGGPTGYSGRCPDADGLRGIGKRICGRPRGTNEICTRALCVGVCGRGGWKTPARYVGLPATLNHCVALEGLLIVIWLTPAWRGSWAPGQMASQAVASCWHVANRCMLRKLHRMRASRSISGMGQVGAGGGLPHLTRG
eukprot:364638-Chlamydomonas_euryale.AAC.6